MNPDRPYHTDSFDQYEWKKAQKRQQKEFWASVRSRTPRRGKKRN